MDRVISDIYVRFQFLSIAGVGQACMDQNDLPQLMSCTRTFLYVLFEAESL